MSIMANILAWKSDVAVDIEGVGEFEISVKRLPMSKRQELKDLVEKIEKLDANKKTPESIDKKMEKFLGEMIIDIQGLSFDWGPDGVVEPHTVEDLLAQWRKYASDDSTRVRMYELFWLTVSEQFVTPHQKKLSRGGQPGLASQETSSQEQNGTTTQTVTPAVG